MSNYTVSIVIPNYKRSELLTKLLDSLVNAQWPENFVDIIVVENGDNPSNEPIIASFTGRLPVKYLYIKEAGASPARNHGIEESKSDIIIFFDDDVTVSKDCLQAYRSAFDQYGLEYFYGGSLAPNYQKKPQDWLLQLLPDCAKGFTLCNKNTVQDSQCFLGANLAIPKMLLNKVNSFDRYGPTGESNSGYCGEETRLQKRLYTIGYCGIFVADALVHHYVPEEHCSESWLLQRRYRQGFGSSLYSEISTEKSKSIFGIPAWIMLKLTKFYFKLIFQTLLKEDKKKKFITMISIKNYHGMMAGHLKKYFLKK
jgi:glycosyltransferase involved in cell wall biosynthesis